MGTREYVGAGGMRLHLDEPLSDEMAKQVAKGQLQPVVGQAGNEDVQETPASGGDVERPAKNAPVADWRAYAIALGMDPDQAETATKADCQDYAQVVEDAREQGE